MRLSEEQKKKITAGKTTKSSTYRVSVQALEKILFEPFPALDHGFLRVVDYMGDDNAVVQAARVSYGSGTKHVSKDRELIRYLMRHCHTTPFEMCEIKFHVKLPIFVARQWIRHRTASVNEYSARYSIMAKEFYLPSPENLAAQSTQNAQGRGQVLSQSEQAFVLKILEENALRCYTDYELMLNEGKGRTKPDSDRIGLARELARMNLTLNMYTEWYWKTNLHNLLHFISLRTDMHAQYEIRVYANIMLKILEAWVPLTTEAFRDYRLEAVSLSVQQLKAVRAMLQRKTVTAEDVGLSKGEWSELLSILSK